MIKNIELKNFKAFESLELSLGKVNLLTGLNGMGKSTVIQSLLLLKQSFSNPANQELQLNGSYVQLGQPQDILYEKAMDDTITVSVSIEDKIYKLGMLYSLKDKSLKMVSYYTEIASRLKQLYYLSAERIVPSNNYPITDSETVEFREFGKDGRFALQYLYLHGSEALPDGSLLLGNDSDNSLLRQASLWMEYITPGTNIEVQVNNALQLSELRYSFREGTQVTKSFRNINVGFGLTYVLPIVVQILTAKPGDVIMLENPEAHIHPAGQLRLGELAAKAGANGIQVIVETHSDHFINGIRLAAKKRTIQAEEVRIFYFYKDQENNFRHSVKTPVLYQNGQISEWPKGFMDEWETALLELLQ